MFDYMITMVTLSDGFTIWLSHRLKKHATMYMGEGVMEALPPKEFFGQCALPPEFERKDGGKG